MVFESLSLSLELMMNKLVGLKVIKPNRRVEMEKWKVFVFGFNCSKKVIKGV